MSKSAIFVAAVFVLAVGSFFWNLANPTPTRPVRSMEPPDLSGIADGAPIVDVILPETLSESAQIGKRVFENSCAVCHGTNAAGQNGVAPPLVHITYEPNHHSDLAFVMAAKNGVQSHHWAFGNMPPIQGLTDGDVKLIARYIRELQEANGIF